MIEEPCIAAAAETRAARNSQQPLSFVPPADMQPRMRTHSNSMTPTAPSAANTPAAPAAVDTADITADDIYMQVQLTVPFSKRCSLSSAAAASSWLELH
jgi:hypothetical protein